MNEEFLLQVKGLHKTFGGVTAIANVGFALRKGETLGIIGPNGSGKTTLVNLITRFVKQDFGQVFFKGKEISRLKPYRIVDMGIARTFQVMRPFYSLPAFKNLIIPLSSPRGKRAGSGKLGDKDAVAIDILEEIGFERDAYVPYKAASSLPLGYLKRLELARCLALRPEIIICDEIFSGLSMAEIATMVPLIERLQMEGKTIIMIEHRLRELFQLIDRVIVLNFGVKIAEGEPHEVLSHEEVKKAYLGRKGI
jgi:ABC-type branched-subunit amino acid transport system ATPase component